MGTTNTEELFRPSVSICFISFNNISKQPFENLKCSFYIFLRTWVEPPSHPQPKTRSYVIHFNIFTIHDVPRYIILC